MSLLHPPTTVRPPSILTLHPLRPISTIQSRLVSLPHFQTLKPPKIRLTASVTSSVSGGTKEQTWTHEGLITDSLSNGMFKVELTNGEVILGHLSGKIRKNTIRVMTGDRVSVEVSRYDSSRGRIVFRLRADGTKGTPKKGHNNSSPRKGPKGDRGD